IEQRTQPEANRLVSSSEAQLAPEALVPSYAHATEKNAFQRPEHANKSPCRLVSVGITARRRLSMTQLLIYSEDGSTCSGNTYDTNMVSSVDRREASETWQVGYV